MITELISVGTEILLGNIVNTNSAYLSEKCALLGLSVYYQDVVGDNEGRMRDVIRTALDRSDVVILTGGLGPTEDDITKEVTADLMGMPLKEDSHSRKLIDKYLKEYEKNNPQRRITKNNYKQAMAAYAKGISVATHTGNVMTDMHHRDIGGLGAALTNENVTCEVICDGLHICDEMLGIYFKVKSTDKFMMVSDCTALSGAPVGKYEGIFEGMALNVTPEGFVLTDTGRLCGSSQPVLFDIRNLVNNVGIPLETCLKMACLNPCIKYGFADRKGTIEVGKDADLVVISDDYQAQVTYAEGRKVYDRSTEGKIFNADYLNR